MFQTPDYTILDHLTAMCAVVDAQFRYLYVNKAAAKHEQMSREEMLGHTIMELHANRETDLLVSHLQECLRTREPVEFEDLPTRLKIKIEPMSDGAFIHWIRLPASKTKVKIKSTKRQTSLRLDSRYPPILVKSQVLEIDGWLDSLDVRTKESNAHITNVADTTVALASMAGIPEYELVYIHYGALLHDIGKIGIPERILLKPEALTAAEWDVIRKHPLYAYDLFSPVEFLRSCLSIPYSHHERWDGTGYPQGLKGEQIPLAARLFAIIDVWDTLSFDRVYRKAWSYEKIMDYLQGQSGSQFDPNVVDLFFHVEKELIGFEPR